MLFTLLLLTALSLALSLALTPLVRRLALHWNLVDLPDDKRKIHRVPIPRVGGIAVMAAYFGSSMIVAAFLTVNHLGGLEKFGALKSIAPAVLLIFLVGLTDDLFTLEPWHKFAVQAVAALLVVSSGHHIEMIASFKVHPILGMVATAVWLVACTNAVNLLDGLDGLAAGVALLATLTTLVASLMSGNLELNIATAPLAGALIGFLVFNFNPASIFLGDSGSLVLGFLLGCFSTLWTGKTATMVNTLAPLMALAVPLLDTSLAIARRFLRGQPVFRPDRAHIHHRLLARGLSHRGAVLSLYLASSLAGILSLSLMAVRNHWETIIVGLFICAILCSIKHLSYTEFQTLQKLILNGCGLRSEINAQIAVKAFEEDLKQASTAQDCWEVVQGSALEFGLEAIGMRLDGRTYHCPDRCAVQSWAIRIHISGGDWIDLSNAAAPIAHPTAALAFAETIRKVLAGRKVDSQPEIVSATLYATVVPIAS